MQMMEMELRRGYNFCPTDEQAIQYYLKKKVMGQPLAFEGIVLERNPYDEKQLPDIFAAAEKRDIYFFTKLTRKGRTLEGSNFSRTVGNGTWHGDRTADIKDERGSLIGTAKTFGYTEKGSKKKKLIMTQYALPTNDTSLPYNPSKDWVLCRVKSKCRSGSTSGNIQGAPLLFPAVDHDLVDGSSSYASSVENGSPEVTDALVPLDYDTNTTTAAYYSSPEVTDALAPLDYDANTTTAAYYSSPEVTDALVPLDYDTNTTTAAHYSSYPSSVVGNSYTCVVEATSLPTGTEISVQDGKDELLDMLLAIDYYTTGDGFPSLGALEDDILMGMDYAMDSSAATPITDFPVSTGDEFPPLETLVTLEDNDITLSDTHQSMDNQDHNVWTAEELEPSMNAPQEQFGTDNDLQFTPSFMTEPLSIPYLQ